MYVRKDPHRIAGGRVRRYVSFAHNVVETLPDGRKRTKPVIFANLGPEDDLDEATVRGMVGALDRYIRKRFGDGTPPEAQLREAAAPIRSKEKALALLGGRAFGLVHVVAAVWKSLGLDRALHGVAAQRALGFDLERVVFAMVAHRLIDPGSKLACNEWVRDEAWLPEAASWDVHPFYRALDVLDEHADEITDALARAMASQLTPAELRLLLIDTTSSYFETLVDDVEAGVAEAGEVPLRRRGHSKDHRADAPQVVVGLVTTADGVPLRHGVYPGNMSDQAITVELAERAAADVPGSRVVIACDSGMGGGPNLAALDARGLDRVSGVPFRSLAFADEELLSRAGRWRNHPTNPEMTWRAHLVPAEESPSGRAEWWIATRNAKDARRQRAAIGKHVSLVEATLSRDDHHDGHGRPTCKALSKPALARFVTVRGTRLVVDRERVAHEQRWAGVKVLRSTLADLDPLVSLSAYTSLHLAEDQFRNLKGPLALRPMYHRAPRRVRAHVLVCMLALACLRWVESKVGAPFSHVHKAFRTVQAVQVEHGRTRHWQRSEWSDDARRMLTAMGIPEGRVSWGAETVR